MYAITVNEMRLKIKRIKLLLQFLMITDDDDDFDLFLLCVAYYRRLKRRCQEMENGIEEMEVEN